MMPAKPSAGREFSKLGLAATGYGRFTTRMRLLYESLT